MNETLERFWSKVDKTGDCWEWKERCLRNGYGMFWSKGKTQSVHRFSWELSFGSIPDGLLVLHTCDNRRCVRPDHLWLGTHADNQTDMARKDRSTHGETHANSKLEEAEVLAIRGLASSSTQRLLARLFGISQKQISNIIRRKNWARI